MPKLFLVEDHHIIRQVLARTLAGTLQIEICGEAGTGEEALPAILEKHPDVLLLDLRLPGMSGLEVAETVKLECPSTRIVAFSSQRDDYTLARVRSLRLHGFVHKSEEDFDVLVQAIGQVLEGRAFFSPIYESFVQRHLNDPLNFERILSERERELLPLFGEGLNNEEIGEKLGLSHYTVQAHRRNIMGKLDLHSLGELARYAQLKGFTNLNPS